MARKSDLMTKAKQRKALVSLVTLIGETVALRRSGRDYTGLCPFHVEKTPSFYVYPDHYHCYGCSAHGDVFSWLRATRRMTFVEAVNHLEGTIPPSGMRWSPQRMMQPVRRSTQNTTWFLHSWNQGIDPAGTPVEIYLRSRGLELPDDGPVRFHPRCQRGGKHLPGGPEYWPAMLALMTDPITGQPVGLHRTYLLPDGSAKAPVTKRGLTVLKPKMILGTWGVVRLVPYTNISRALAIAEGIENALTAMQVIGWGPAWAAGTQDCLKKLPVLPWLEAISIFADADDTGTGLTAARVCAERWGAAGREALIHIPPKGRDWNDAVRELIG